MLSYWGCLGGVAGIVRLECLREPCALMRKRRQSDRRVLFVSNSKMGDAGVRQPVEKMGGTDLNTRGWN